MSSRDDEALSALLADLEATLEDLRTELDDDRRGRRDDRRRDRRENGRAGGRDDRRRSRRADDRPRRDRRDRREGPQFDPPSVSDVLRFTNEYTIPTLIATLEATISALELFQKVVGVVAPDDSRPPRRRDRGLDGVVGDASDRATDQLTRRLDDLRTALSETDLPQDGEARDIVSEARALTEEIESRVRDSRATVDDARRRDRREGRRDDRDRGSRDRGDRDRGSRDRDGRRGRGDGRDDGPVEIAVGDPDDTDDGPEASDTEEDPADDPETGPEVDVEAELQSIKREFDDGDDGDDEET